jgi:hypothetical protein
VRQRIVESRTALQTEAQQALVALLQAEEELRSAKRSIKNSANP